MNKKQFESMKQSDRIEYMLRLKQHDIPFFKLTISFIWITFWVAMIALGISYYLHPAEVDEILRPALTVIVLPLYRLVNTLWDMILLVFLVDLTIIIFLFIRRANFNKKWKKKASLKSEK